MGWGQYEYRERRRQREAAIQELRNMVRASGAHKKAYDFTPAEWREVQKIYATLPTSSSKITVGYEGREGHTIDLGRRRAAVRGFYEQQANDKIKVRNMKETLGKPGTRQQKQSKSRRPRQVRHQAGAPKSVTFTGRYTPRNRQSLKISGGLN